MEKEFNRRKGTREIQINERKATETDRKRKKVRNTEMEIPGSRNT